MPGGGGFYIVAPVGRSGIAFLGDPDHFVSLGRKRIVGVTDGGLLEAAISFAEGETARTVHGYAPEPPIATAVKGAAGAVEYDASTQRFRVEVSPGPDRIAVIDLKPGRAGSVN